VRDRSGGREFAAYVPASVANLGAGFDVHSIALREPSITVAFALGPSGYRKINVYGPYANDVTSDPSLHASSKALDALLERFRRPEGYSLRIKVSIPPRKGLGLSGAEAVGSVLCADRMFRLGLDIKDVLNSAAAAEPSRHMDNVAASALGGFNIISQGASGQQPEIVTLKPPADLGVGIVVPDIEKPSTEQIRKVLPQMVSREQYVKAMSYAARTSAAFASGDVNGIIKSIPWDPVIEPARADAGCYGKGIDADSLLKEKQMLLERYHVAETISGAGPSRALWYSLSEDRRARRRKQMSVIDGAIERVSMNLESAGHKVLEVYRTRPTARGAHVLSAVRRT